MYLNYGQGSNVTVMLQVEGVSQEWTCIVLLYGGILDQWDFSRSAQPSPTFQFLLLFPHPFSLSLSSSSSLSPSLLSPFFLISIPSSLSPFLLLLLPLPPAPSLPPSFQELRLIFPNAQRLNQMPAGQTMSQISSLCTSTGENQVGKVVHMGSKSNRHCKPGIYGQQPPNFESRIQGQRWLLKCSMYCICLQKQG